MPERVLLLRNGNVLAQTDAFFVAHRDTVKSCIGTRRGARPLQRYRGADDVGIAEIKDPRSKGHPDLIAEIRHIAQAINAGEIPPAGFGKLLSTWVQSTLRGDLTSQVKCYGPQVEVFFTKRDITREDVRLEKQKVLTEFPEVKAYDISGLEIESAGADRVVINFRKRWDSSGNTGKQFSGEEKERLTLARFGEQWLIVGEEELQIFRVHKGK